MALGSNRDYATTHRATMEAIRRRGLVNLWECRSCGRKNLQKHDGCPRCGRSKRKELK
jgi:rubrerythrin